MNNRSGFRVTDLVLLASWRPLAQQVSVLLIVDLQHAGLHPRARTDLQLVVSN